MRHAAAVLVILCLALAPARAQQSVPYEGQLLRLSELLGALHHLRALCGGPEGPAWRQKMAALIQSETQDSDMREKMAGAFNRGYRTFSLTYRTCNGQARTVIENYLAEGRQLAGDLASRYAN